MVRTATEKKAKTATKAANESKTKSKPKAKGTRAPSAYNLYMKEHLKSYKDENPGVAQKDAMKAVAVLWRDAPENPKRGQEPKTKTKKAPQAKSKKPGDETATSEPEPSSDD